jgi:type II secretion system protein N
MLNKTLRWFGSSIGYLLYGVGVFVLLLWLLFPKEAMRRFVETSLGRVSPQMTWQVGAVKLEFPALLTAQAIEGREQGGANTIMARIDALTLRPNFGGSLESRSLQIDYRLSIGKGNVAGNIRLMGEEPGLHVEGAVDEIKLTDVPLLSQRLGRTLQGTISGSYVATVDPNKGEVNGIEAKLSAENGRLGLRRPLFGHTELPFSLGTVILRGQGERLALEQGRLESALCGGQFSGKLLLHSDPALSALDVQGHLFPKAAFFKGMDSTLALQAFRVQLKDNSLPFRISGNLSDPGIHYEDFSMLVQNLEKELK